MDVITWILDSIPVYTEPTKGLASIYIVGSVMTWNKLKSREDGHQMS